MCILIVLSPVKEVRTCVSGPLIEEGHPTIDAMGSCCAGAGACACACPCACDGFRSAQELAFPAGPLPAGHQDVSFAPTL